MFFLLVTYMSMLLLGSSILSGDSDVAYHLLLGRIFLQEGSLPAVEPTLIFPAPHAPFFHEWLSEILMATFARLGGLNAILLASCAVVSGTLTVLLVRLLKRGVPSWIAVLSVAWCFLLLRNHFIARPHIFSWALFLASFFILERQRKRGSSLTSTIIALLPVSVVWTNLHGGVIYLFVVLGALWLDALSGELFTTRRRRFFELVLLSGTVLGGSLLNPYGPGLYLHIAKFIFFNRATRYVHEYMSPFVLADSVWLTAYCASLATALWMLWRLPWRAKRPELPGLILLIILGINTAFAARHAPFYALIFAYLAAIFVSDVLKGRRRTRLTSAVLDSSERLKNLDVREFCVISAVLLLLIAQRFSAPGDFDRTLLPVDAASQIEKNFSRYEQIQIFSSYEWSGYLAYRLRPRGRVFIHGMNDLYGEQLFLEYRDILRGKTDSIEKLHDAGINVVVLPLGAPLIEAVRTDATFTQVHSDDLCVVFQRAPL